MSDLYDADVVTWSERQAALLRRIANGERINDQVDWANVIEEVESVGQSQIDAVESLLTQAFLHDLKAAAWPTARDAENWRADARLFRRQAQRKYRASMQQRIDIAGLYADALAGLPELMDGQPPSPVPAADRPSASKRPWPRHEARGRVGQRPPPPPPPPPPPL